MLKAIQTSVSGLIASSVRLSAVASNIANAQVESTPIENDLNGASLNGGYTPVRVEQTSTGLGGVQATIVPVTPASLTIFNPSSPLANSQGAVNIPNVSLPVEFGELIKAEHAYKANAKVLRTLDDTFKTLLKI